MAILYKSERIHLCKLNLFARVKHTLNGIMNNKKETKLLFHPVSGTADSPIKLSYILNAKNGIANASITLRIELLTVVHKKHTTRLTKTVYNL